MFGPKMGTWTVYCESDPRWNKSGRAEGLCCEGGPPAMQDWIKLCTEQYGKPPADAAMSFYKD